MIKANTVTESSLDIEDEESEDEESEKDQDIDSLVEHYGNIEEVIRNLFQQNEELTQKEEKYKTLLADITATLEKSLAVYEKRRKNQKLAGEYYSELKEAESILETAVDKCLQGVENKDAFLFNEKKQAIKPLRLRMAELELKIKTIKKDVQKSKKTLHACKTELDCESNKNQQQQAQVQNTVNLLLEIKPIFTELSKEIEILCGRLPKPKYKKSLLAYKPFSITEGLPLDNEHAEASYANDEEGIKDSSTLTTRAPISADELDVILERFNTPKDLAKYVLEDNLEKKMSLQVLRQKIEAKVDELSKITDLNNQANKYVSYYNAHLQQVSEEVSESHKIVESLQKIGRFFTLDSTAEIINRLQQKIKELEEKYNELLGRQSSFSKEITELEIALNNLKEKNRELESLNQNLTDLYAKAYYTCINARQYALLLTLTLEGTVGVPYRSVRMSANSINYGAKGLEEILTNLTKFPQAIEKEIAAISNNKNELTTPKNNLGLTPN